MSPPVPETFAQGVARSEAQRRASLPVPENLAERSKRLNAAQRKGTSAAKSPTLDPWYKSIRHGIDIEVTQFGEVVQIVDHLVGEQSKLVIGSGSKSFKTWLTIQLSLCISAGIPFLDAFEISEPRKVLYCNLELKQSTFERRVQTVAKALGITGSQLTDFAHLPLRGQLSGQVLMNTISRLVNIVKHDGVKVVVLDPVYKLNTQGDENSSKDMTVLFNEIDRLTTEGECTVIINDHFGKGNQSEKDPLDAIRGSSAKAGDLDAAMVLRKHEVEDCFRVDIIHRELAPVKPFTIGWKFPLMGIREDLNPDAMKKAKGGQAKKHDPEALCAAIIDSTAENPISISAWAGLAGIKRPTLQGYLPGLRSKGWITTVGQGSSARQHLTEKGKNAANRYLENEPE